MPRRAAKPVAVPASLPRGPHALPRDVVLLSQRRRLLDAMVLVVAQKGYAATTVTDVIKNAKVSRTTFYEQFADKEACFLAAYDEGGKAHYSAVRGAIEAMDEPLDQIRAGVHVYLATLAAEPAFARAFLVEIMAAGPQALALRDKHQQRYVKLLMRFPDALRDKVKTIAPISAEVMLAGTSAIDQLIVLALREDRLDRLVELEATALYIVFALLSVPRAAQLAGLT